MAIEPKFPGDGFEEMFGGAPPQNRRARLMLNALLRQRLKWRTRYEPSHRVLFAVIASLALILGIMLVGIFHVYATQDPARYLWILGAIVLACLAPYGIGLHIVRSARKQASREDEKDLPEILNTPKKIS